MRLFVPTLSRAQIWTNVKNDLVTQPLYYGDGQSELPHQMTPDDVRASAFSPGLIIECFVHSRGVYCAWISFIPFPAGIPGYQ